MPRLPLKIRPQPDDTTCGPTCLHAIYQYYGDNLPLHQVIAETCRLDHGGTLDVFLALHALKRGYHCEIYPFNMRLFDPTWFSRDAWDIAEALRLQAERKDDPVLQLACHAYVEFLELGGKLVYHDLTSSLIRGILRSGTPILTGLNANYLYRSCREEPLTSADDPIGGEPSGHFVVLFGYNKGGRKLLVADPYLANPMDTGHFYRVGVERLMGAVLLGVLSFDANLLVIRKKDATLCVG